MFVDGCIINPIFCKPYECFKTFTIFSKMLKKNQLSPTSPLYITAKNVPEMNTGVQVHFTVHLSKYDIKRQSYEAVQKQQIFF